MVLKISKHTIAVGHIFSAAPHSNGYARHMMCTGHTLRTMRLGRWGIAVLSY
jgi:hypothetical protein